MALPKKRIVEKATEIEELREQAKAIYAQIDELTLWCAERMHKEQVDEFEYDGRIVTLKDNFPPGQNVAFAPKAFHRFAISVEDQ